MYDVFGLGNALVDMEVKIDEQFLTSHQITKGHMTLVDSEQMQALANALEGTPMNRCSGGSAANTIYAIQAFGLQTCYACKVAHDETGDFFVTDLTSSGVALASPNRAQSGSSGRCLVMITDDAERTMTTDLAVSSELSVEDLTPASIQNASVYYVEGYLSSSPTSTAAAITCREISEEANTKVAVSLSDPSMIEFFRTPLEEMLGNGVDTLFCNEEEALQWAGTDRLDIALKELGDIAPEVYVTLGANGSIAQSHGGGHKQSEQVSGFPTQAVDTTGAGDIFAGACIAARLQGAEPANAASFANFCAARLVAQYGARLGDLESYKKLKASYT